MPQPLNPVFACQGTLLRLHAMIPRWPSGEDVQVLRQPRTRAVPLCDSEAIILCFACSLHTKARILQHPKGHRRKRKWPVDSRVLWNVNRVDSFGQSNPNQKIHTRHRSTCQHIQRGVKSGHHRAPACAVSLAACMLRPRLPLPALCTHAFPTLTCLGFSSNHSYPPLAPTHASLHICSSRHGHQRLLRHAGLAAGRVL